jgi:Protein of unknown function (DUF1778)
MKRRRVRCDVVINMRASREERDLIDAAAQAEGLSRSEFILSSARQRAEATLARRMMPEGLDLGAGEFDFAAWVTRRIIYDGRPFDPVQGVGLFPGSHKAG